MPTQVQFRRGTTAQNNNFIGAVGELSIDTTKGTIRVHDGVTSGGSELVTTLGTASFATNIVGGSTGSLPYQTAAGATDFINIGGANTVLVSDGSTATWVSLGTLTGAGGVNADNILVSSIASSGDKYLVLVDSFGTYQGPEGSTAVYFNASNGLTVDSTTTVGGHILPDTDGVYSLGSPSKKFDKLYLTSATLFLDTIELSGTSTFLTVNGAQVITTATLNAVTAGTASNLAGGTAGQVPYQSGAGATSFFGPGTAGQILVSAGAAAPVYTNTANIYVNDSVNAEKWLTPRTFTFGGDLTGSMVVDGSQNVTFTATIAADSVALGTDTTGNYVAGVSAGTGVAVSGSGSEGATVTISNLGVLSLTPGTGIATDGSTGSLTLTNLGVTSITGGGGVTVSGSTGSVTLGFTTSTLVQTASNLAGGSQGQIAYQSAAGTTAFANSGTTGQFLQATTNGAPVWTSTGSMYVYRATQADTAAGSAGSVANALTIGAGLSGGSFNGSSAVTITNLGVTAIAGTAPISLSASTGSVTVSLTTGSAYVADSVNAEKWKTARTFTFGGDLTGSMVVDGSQNVTFTATIAADSVALGTDTTGNYVAAGATSGFGLSGSASSEGSTFTVTANSTSANTVSTIVFRDGNGDFSARTLTLTGDLVVQGTTVTVNSTVTNVSDPIITIGSGPSGAAPSTDDNKDRGIAFQWHNGSASKVGFFGYDDSTGYLTFVPDATITNEVISGTQGDIQATNFRGTLIGSISNALTIGSGLSGGSYNGSSAVTITNLGVTGLTAGTGIATDGSTGTVTLTNVGVTSLTGGGGVTVSGSTGSVTLGFTTSTLVQTASNLAGGSQGQIAYQSAAGTTAFANSGTTGQFLQATTNGAPVFTSTSSMYVYRATQADTAAGSAGSVANALTIGSGLSGGSFNGSSAVTITNLGVTSLAATGPVAVSGSTGSVTVSLTTGSTYVADAVNAEKWKTPRTFTFGGDLTGSMVVDGSQNVTFTATIAADSVALGTDTTGNYLATATAGTGISVAGSGVESAAITITNLGVTQLTAGTGIATNGSTGSLTLTNVGVTGLAATGPVAVSGSTGSVTVSLTTGSTYVANAVNAEKWLTPRTFTFGGDLTGSMVVDGSQNVTFTATIAADSVALGTDTTGNYVGGISAGTAIAVSGSGVENATVTITNLGVGSLTGGGGVTVSASTGSVTLGFTTSTLVQTASNLAGGSQGQIAYQSAAGTTAFANSGTTGQFLQATTNGAPVFTSTSSMYVADSVNAEKWKTARTLTLTGDVTGSASIDGSGNVNLATTVSADATALGTDTTGVYVATATGGTGISVAGSGVETAALTITNLGVTSVAAGTGVTVSGSTGSVTISLSTASVYSGSSVTAERWATARTFTFGGDLTGSMVVDGSQNVTFTATIAADSVALGTDTTGNYVGGISAGTAIAVSGSGAENATVTITNLGVGSLTGGGGVTVSASTGSVTLGFTTSTLVQTASNLAGGTAGQLPYQSAAGSTAFMGPGTAGQILVSAGASAPVYTNTASIYVNSAVNAEEIRGGTAGQLVYQSAAGVTDFVGPGTAGQILVSAGTSAPTYTNTGSIYVGNATKVDTVAQTANANYFVTFVDANNATGAQEVVGTTSTFTINPATGAISGSSLTLTGNLVVQGTTFTVNSTVTNVSDPIITIGGGAAGAAPSADDNKDRGIAFQWHNGTAAKIGFFGYDDSTGYLTFVPDATITNEVITGTAGDIQATNFRGALVGNADTASSAAKWTTARTITLGGDLSGSVSIDGSANVTLTATIGADSVALGTDTSGNYVAAGATSGWGLSGSAGAEGATFTVTSNGTSTNTANSLVFRDGSGNFSAGAITSGAITSTAAAGVLHRAAATQDGIEIRGRAGGTGNWEAILTPTTLSADRTFTFPDVSGTVVTTGDTGSITSTMILDGTIVNADINASAAIAITKLAASTISGVSLGNNLNTLTIGAGLSGGSYNGSAAVTITNLGVTSLAGTANQITASASTGSVTLSLPQSVNSTASVQFGSLGIGTAASGTAGEIRATNEITAYYTSDARLKENVVVIGNALEKLDQIRGVYFDWKDEHIQDRGGEDGYFVRKHDVGVIAQEVEAVLPEVVATRDNGFKAVKYEKLVALLIAAVKEQQQQIAQLSETINKLAAK